MFKDGDFTHTNDDTILKEEVDHMGRDEHNHSKGRNHLAQTPKGNIKSDGQDVEFVTEFADSEDKEAQARSQAADKRAKGK